MGKGPRTIQVIAVMRSRTRKQLRPYELNVSASAVARHMPNELKDYTAGKWMTDDRVTEDSLYGKAQEQYGSINA